MSINGEPQKINCPSCGGPVEMTGPRTECPFCGAVVERPTSATPRKIVLEFPGLATRQATRAGRVGCIAVSAALVVMAGIAVVIWLLLAQQASPALPAFPAVGRLSRKVEEISLPIPMDRPGPPDMLLVTRDVDTQAYMLTYLDGAQYTRVWDGPPLSTSNPLVALGKDVYLVDGDRLLALDRTDGKPLWQNTLSDSIRCSDCLRVQGSVVLVLTQDGVLQAFETTTGRPLWNYRLNLPTTYHLYVINGQPAVVDRSDPDDGESTGLHIFNLTDGTLVRTITPRCGGRSGIDAYSPIVLGPSGDALYFFYGHMPGCAERWDPRSGERIWQTVQESVNYDFIEAPPLLEGERIYYVDDEGAIIEIGTADGKVRSLTAAEEDYELLPLAVGEGTMLVQARRTRGSERYELWGLDLTTGEWLWKQIYKGEEPISEPGAWASPAWDVRLTPRGAVVLHLLSDPPRVVVETLDPRTGESAGRVENMVEDDYWPDVAWSGNFAWVVVRHLYTVDLTTGKVVNVWP